MHLSSDRLSAPVEHLDIGETARPTRLLAASPQLEGINRATRDSVTAEGANGKIRALTITIRMVQAERATPRRHRHHPGAENDAQHTVWLPEEANRNAGRSVVNSHSVTGSVF